MKRQIILTSIIALAVISITTVPFVQNVQAQSLVPDWIKSNAGWWAEGTVDDITFLNGITFLIENGIINVSSGSKNLDVDKITIGFIPIEKADELKISISTVYKTLSVLENLALVEVEQYVISAEGKKIKQYRSRIGKVEITLESLEPSLSLYPNTLTVKPDI